MLSNILVLIILFVTNTIQAITGFAGTLLAMPPTIKLIGPDEAKILLTLVAQISCALIVITGWKHINWREFLRMLVLMVIGMAVGMKIYEVFPMNMLLIFYGILIIIIAVIKLKGSMSPTKTEQALPAWVYVVVILAAGIIHGMFSSGGALLVVYATHALKDKEEFRATMAMIWVTVGFYITGVQMSHGYLNSHVLFLLAAGLIPVFIGTWIGSKLVKKIDQQVFLRITYVLLVISGVLAIV